MKIICKILGHKYKQYLQMDDKNLDGEPMKIDGMLITRIIRTYFLCCKCGERLNKNESFFKEADNDD